MVPGDHQGKNFDEFAEDQTRVFTNYRRRTAIDHKSSKITPEGSYRHISYISSYTKKVKMKQCVDLLETKFNID